MSQADDRILEDLLRRRREEPRPSGGPLCGDPELLAAFVEDALAGSAREDMDRHLAACSACREAVARLVRLAPRPVVVAPQPQRVWWKRWVWAAPALASIVLVGSFVMFNRGRIVEQPPQMVAKQVPAPPAVVPQQPAAEPSANDVVRPEAAAKPRRSAVKEETRVAAAPAEPPPPPVSVAAEKEKDKKEELKAEADTQKAQMQEQQALRFREGASARQSQARDQAQAQAAPAPSQQQVQVFAKAPPQTAPPGEPAKGAPVGGIAGGAGQAKLAGGMLRTSPATAKASAETVVVEPTATNVLADDRVDKVGKDKKFKLLLPSDTKIAQTVRVKNRVWTLLADGRLLLSLDNGTTWQEVAVPERPKKLTARDPDHVEITAVSGRVYRSIDGGASWVLVPSR